MEAQELFYAIASISLLLVSGFVIFFFYVIYKINQLAKTGFKTLNYTARDIQHSFGNIARGWGRATMVGLVIKAVRAFILRR